MAKEIALELGRRGPVFGDLRGDGVGLVPNLLRGFRTSGVVVARLIHAHEQVPSRLCANV